MKLNEKMFEIGVFLSLLHYVFISIYLIFPLKSPVSVAQAKINQNERSLVRDALISTLTTVSVSDISSLKMWSGVLATSTNSIQEISRQSAVFIFYSFY